jgi:hypothetical protein
MHGALRAHLLEDLIGRSVSPQLVVCEFDALDALSDGSHVALPGFSGVGVYVWSGVAPIIDRARCDARDGRGPPSPVKNSSRIVTTGQ